MTTTATATRAATPLPLDEKNGSLPETGKNLYQRLAAITAEVAVKATGKTAFGPTATISITDAERALGDLTAKHGVVTGYRWNAKPEQQGSLWLADLTVWMVNADDPDDEREETVYDVGNSPSAAVSYAIKRYYRALFHLADEQDEQRTVSGSHPPPAPAAARTTVTRMSTAEQARIEALNKSLPAPVPPVMFDALLRDLPYDKALAQITMKHEAACGVNCTHVKNGGLSA